MYDFLNTNMKMTTFSQENITKVPAQIHFKKTGGFLFFNMLLEGLDVLGVHLKKSDEWFFGLYHGGTYNGYLHFGEIPKEDHQKLCDQFFPMDRNNLQSFIKINQGRLEYHESASESWRFIGELENKKIIQKN
ncbi:hypothetical protein RCH13_000983 [Chryseobacterium sp. MP_3.2]|nr:hypothetical protein [Chryseobacterium sp. MP_3.2]